MLAGVRSSSHRPGALVGMLLVASACRSNDAHVQPGDGPPAVAPDLPAPAPITGGSALVVACAGWDALLSDPRDAGLRRALAMLDERLLELPAELGGGAPPPGSLELLFDVFSSPWCLSVDVVQDGDWSQGLPVRAQLSVRTADPDSLSERLAALLAMLVPVPAAPAQGRPELKVVELPAGRLFFGRSRGGDEFVLSWGEPWASWPDLGSVDLPAGVEPVLALGLDLAELRQPLETFLALAGPEADLLRRQLEYSGLLGDHPLGVTVAAGSSADRTLWATRYRNWVEVARAAGSLVEEPLTREELRLVPADTTFAALVKSDPRTILRALEMIDEQGEAAAALEAALGVQLGPDLVEPLGRTFGFYLSDTTGGGGLASAVLFLAVQDEARLAQTLEELSAVLERLASEKMSGRIRLRTWEHEGTSCLALAFPGLPVPLEPSLAISSGHLFAAATPQALGAAIDHARSADAGLLAHPAFRARETGSLADLQALSFSDTPRLLREGYGFAGLLASALANAVRSPADASRDPGPVLPPYRDLLAGAFPSLTLTRIQGGDLVAVGQGDRSATANLTAMLGWTPSLFTGFVLAGSLLSLWLMPMRIVESEPLEEAKARADILAIAMALDGYALENGGRYPDSLEALVTPDERGLTYLDTDEIPRDPWGNEYLYEPPHEGMSKPRVFSYGADGVPGGEDRNADIDSDRLEAPHDGG